MIINIPSSLIRTVLIVLAWILFLGVAFEAGTIIVNSVIMMVWGPAEPGKFYMLADLNALYRFDPGHFLAVAIIMIIVAVMKAILFYLILRLLHDKRLNMSLPFSEALGRFIFSMGYLSFAVGMFSLWGVKYTDQMMQRGVTMPPLQHLRISGGDVWMFMSVTLFVIGHIFKKGIEIQSENQLTV